MVISSLVGACGGGWWPSEMRNTLQSIHTHHIGLERYLGVVVSIGICGFYGGDDVSIYAHTCAKWYVGGCINITKVKWRAELLLNRFTDAMLA